MDTFIGESLRGDILRFPFNQMSPGRPFNTDAVDSRIVERGSDGLLLQESVPAGSTNLAIATTSNVRELNSFEPLGSYESHGFLELAPDITCYVERRYEPLVRALHYSFGNKVPTDNDILYLGKLTSVPEGALWRQFTAYKNARRLTLPPEHQHGYRLDNSNGSQNPPQIVSARAPPILTTGVAAFSTPALSLERVEQRLSSFGQFMHGFSNAGAAEIPVPMDNFALSRWQEAPGLIQENMTPNNEFRPRGNLNAAALYDLAMKAISIRSKAKCTPIRRHEGRPGVYHCTVGCKRSFKSPADWRRHEETKYPQNFWFCNFCGDPEHPTVSHLFTRKDKFMDHLRKHNGPADRKLLTTNKLKHVSGFRCPSRCGFCGTSDFQSWARRHDHIGSHFKKGKTMEQWRVYEDAYLDDEDWFEDGVRTGDNDDDDGGNDDDDDDDHDNNDDNEDEGERKYEPDNGRDRMSQMPHYTSDFDHTTQNVWSSGGYDVYFGAPGSPGSTFTKALDFGIFIKKETTDSEFYNSNQKMALAASSEHTWLGKQEDEKEIPCKTHRPLRFLDSANTEEEERPLVDSACYVEQEHTQIIQYTPQDRQCDTVELINPFFDFYHNVRPLDQSYGESSFYSPLRYEGNLSIPSYTGGSYHSPSVSMQSIERKDENCRTEVQNSTPSSQHCPFCGTRITSRSYRTPRNGHNGHSHRSSGTRNPCRRHSEKARVSKPPRWGGKHDLRVSPNLIQLIEIWISPRNRRRT
ncbi:hypothetical protein BS50DRAFT_291421 [Corynespora cassiicola Philippines]|uniref:C2H2-type domain-containing protein n=1 Tax=Corynespora cassiicola Philippines TaxID=1448308 RepID=A0A2T2NW16_CORCC|nr:hypothetical protein BS50DRAFT_291421 [Corynespora cassiicola Philippines]